MALKKVASGLGADLGSRTKVVNKDLTPRFLSALFLVVNLRGLRLSCWKAWNSRRKFNCFTTYSFGNGCNNCHEGVIHRPILFSGIDLQWMHKVVQWL